jgi:hypothetical protein
MNMNFMKDYKILNISQVEEKNNYSGKFSFGVKNQPVKKEA